MIAQKVSFSFVINFLMNALGYISLFFVARYMGPEPLGIIAFALSYIALFQSFSDLGFGTAHIKRISEGKDLGKCNGTYFTAKSILTAVMVIAVLSAVFGQKLITHKEFISKEHEIVLYIILITIVIKNFSQMFIITFSARKETAKQNIPLLIEKIIEVGSKIIVALVGFGVILLAGASLLAAIVGFLCFLYLFRHYPIRKPEKQYFKSYLTFAIPVMFIGFLSKIAQNLDKVMIQYFLNSAEVGYYAAAQRISIIFTFVTAASVSLIFPTISTFHSNGDMESIRRLSNEAERYLSMIFFPAIAFIFVFYSSICVIFLGTKFLSSGPILVVLSLVALINGITQPYAQQTGGTNRIKIAAKISAFIFLLNIFLNLIFIPKKFMGIKLIGMGGIGAAYATLISILLGSIIFRFYAYRISTSKPNIRTLVHIFSALIMGVALQYLNSNVDTILFYHLLTFGILGFCLYIFILVLFREFTRKDFNLFLHILNPIELMSYVKSEVRNREI